MTLDEFTMWLAYVKRLNELEKQQGEPDTEEQEEPMMEEEQEEPSGLMARRA